MTHPAAYPLSVLEGDEMNINNEPFHLSRSSDGTRHWFSARDEASGVSIPAKDRDQAVALVMSLNGAFQHHLKMALATAPASAAEPVRLREALEGIRAVAAQAHRHRSNAGKEAMFLAVIEERATAALTGPEVTP